MKIKNKIFLLLTLFLIGIVQATPLEDLMSNEATNLTITISENETLIDFYLNITGYEWDNQHIEYNGFSFTIPASEILNNINLKQEFNGEITFSDVYIDNEIHVLFDNLFSLLKLNFTCDDINNDSSILTNLMKEYEVNIDGNYSFEKSGNNYKIKLDKGWGLVSEEDRNKSKEYLNELYRFNINNSILNGFDSINPRLLINEYITPYVDYDLSFLEELDYSVEEISDIKLEDGNYKVNVKVNDITKEIYVNLVGLPKYIVYLNNSLSKIEGLPIDANVIVEELTTSYPLPSNLKGLRYFNISVSEITNGTIFFKINKTEITNKDKVFMYVWEGSWVKLATTYLLDNGLEYEYKAYTPHFSIFMVGEELVTSSSSSRSSGSGHGYTTIVKKVVQNASNEEIKPLGEEDDKNETEVIDLTPEKPKKNNWIWAIVAIIILVVGLCIGLVIWNKRN